MNRHFIIVILLFFTSTSFSQICKEDSILMYRGICDFRGKFHSKFNILSKTYTSDCTGCIEYSDFKSNLKKFGLNNENIQILQNRVNSLTEKNVPSFNQSILIEKYSQLYDRLHSNLEMSSNSTIEEFNYYAKKQKNVLDSLRKVKNKDLINIIEVSEPIYNIINENSFVLISYREIGKESLYILYYKKRGNNWIYKGKCLVSSISI